MQTFAFEFCRSRLQADAAGALIWHEQGLLAVADLHFEKATALAKRGLILPAYDTEETISRLGALIARYDPKVVICLGDSFHDIGAGQRVSPRFLPQLTALQHGRDWIWIAGNHDPEIPAGLPGDRLASLELGPLTFRHDGSNGRHPQVIGHYHPTAKINRAGRSIRRKCFALGPNRLILPAFGTFTGGLNVRDPAIEKTLGDPKAALVCGRERVYPLSWKSLGL